MNINKHLHEFFEYERNKNSEQWDAIHKQLRKALTAQNARLYLLGHRSPDIKKDPEIPAKIAEAIYPNDATARDDCRQRCLDAIQRRAKAAESSGNPPVADKRVPLLARLARGDGSIHVRSLSFWPFSGSQGSDHGFLTELSVRFFRQADINLDQPHAGTAATDSVKAALLDGRIHLILGGLADVHNTLFINWFYTPIIISVGALYVPAAGQSHLPDRSPNDALRKALLSYSFFNLKAAVPPSSVLTNIVPCVLKGDAGSLYLRSMLDGAVDRIETLDLTVPQKVAAELSKRSREKRGSLLVANELMCLQVRAQLIEERHRCDAILPLTDSQNTKDPKQRQPLPEYLFGIGVSRLEKDLAAYFHDAMKLYLQLETQTTLALYKTLSTRLHEEVVRCLNAVHEENVEKKAEEFVSYTLGLGRQDSQFNINWRTVLMNMKV